MRIKPKISTRREQMQLTESAHTDFSISHVLLRVSCFLQIVQGTFPSCIRVAAIEMNENANIYLPLLGTR